MPQPAAEVRLPCDPPALTRTTTQSGQMKRKPLPVVTNTSTASPNIIAARESEGNPSALQRWNTAPLAPYLSQSPDELAAFQSFPASVNNAQRTKAVPLQSTQMPIRPRSSYQAPIDRAYSRDHEIPTASGNKFQPGNMQQTSQKRPQLQQHSTDPLPFTSRPNTTTLQSMPSGQPQSTAKDATVRLINRQSVSQFFSASTSTAKKLAKNKWVRAGTKAGANYVMRAVVGDVVSGLINSESNNDNSTATEDTGNGDADVQGTLNSMCDWIGGGDQGNNDSIAAGTDGAYDPAGAEVTGGTYDPTTLELTDGTYDPLATTGADQNIDPMTILAMESLLSSQNPAIDAGGGYNPIYGGYDPNANANYAALFQQNQAAAAGLNTAQQQLNAAVMNGANSAITQGNISTGNAQFQASKTLDWGTDAVPGQTADTWSTNGSGSGNVPGLRNAGLAV